MNITKYNYESYIIDYLDGKLTNNQILELRAFLLLNDEISEQAEGMKDIKLIPEKLHYLHKEQLKKDELHGIQDYYAIAEAENCLSATDQKFIDQHPVSNNLNHIYKLIRLKSNEQIHYPNKNKLYHKKKFFGAYLQLTAMILLLLTLGIHIFHKMNITVDQNKKNIDYKIVPPIVASIYEPLKNNLLPDIIQPSSQQFYKTSQTVDVVSSRHRSSAVMQIIPLPECPLIEPSLDYALNFTSSYTDIHKFEINLTENAVIWKSSGHSFFSDNIFTTMIQAGKILAEKIKNKD